jgi:hypothetical protein
LRGKLREERRPTQKIFMSDKNQSPESLLIGSVKFVKQTAPKYRGGPRCVLSTNGKGRAELRFNLPLLELHPGLQACERVAVFLASDKPALAIFPSSEGTKVRSEPNGARKVAGMPFRALAAKFQRVLYRVEALESPRKGWLLTAIESERRGA